MIYDEDYGVYTGHHCDPRTPEDEPMTRPELIRALAVMGQYELVQFGVGVGVDDDIMVRDSFDDELLRERIVEAFDQGDF